MKVKEIFDLGLKIGIQADPRGAKAVAEYLKQTKKDFEALPTKDKEFFDQEKLVNPYTDCAIHTDDGKTNVKRVMAGIDIEDGEILLASQLNERGKKIDLVIAHHPDGKSLAGLTEVMDMQVEILEKAGVPVHVAEKIMDKRIREVARGVHAVNHYRLIDMAKALEINFINTHTITDNLVNKFITEYINEHKPHTLGELKDLLLELPEYREAQKLGTGPKIVAGSPKSRIGQFLVEMTGGTNGADDIYKELSHHGISTVIGMHMREAAHNIASDSHMNIIIAGHIASDSLGMNLFLDELEKRGIEIVPCGGLIRVSRVKKNKK